MSQSSHPYYGTQSTFAGSQHYGMPQFSNPYMPQGGVLGGTYGGTFSGMYETYGGTFGQSSQNPWLGQSSQNPIDAWTDDLLDLNQAPFTSVMQV